MDSGGELAGFADGDKTQTELVGKGHAKDKASGFNADDAVWLMVDGLFCHQINSGSQAVSIL